MSAIKLDMNPSRLLSLKTAPHLGIDQAVGARALLGVNWRKNAVSLQPCIPFNFPFLQHRLRYGVGKSEGDEIGASFLAPVREIPVVDLEFEVRVKRLENRRVHEGMIGKRVHGNKRNIAPIWKSALR